MAKYLICGGRKPKERNEQEAQSRLVRGWMELNLSWGDVVITGGATGVDSVATAMACDVTGNRPVIHPADWAKHGIAAGPIRNQKMLDIENPEYVVAFPGGRGTADMVRRARAGGFPVILVEPMQ